MSYKRKQEEKKRYRRLEKQVQSYPPAVFYTYWRSNPHWRRYWKSQGRKSCWASNKRYARRKARVAAKRTDVYTNKICDPWYMTW